MGVGSFTKKSHKFTCAARDLSDSLKSDYGDNVSISQFEKFVSAIPSMTDDQRNLLYVDGSLLVLMKNYRDARAARDAERDSFRGDVQIGNVDTGLAALVKLGENLSDDDDEKKEEKRASYTSVGLN